MIKGIFVVLLLFIGVLLTPALRRPIEPQLESARLFLGDKFDGPLSPVVNPFRRLKARSEIGKAITELLQDRNTGYPPPEPLEFTTYMIRKVRDTDGVDPWGSAYIIVLKQDSVAVVSPGPDRAINTDDDVSKQIRYRWWRENRPGARR
jgi:hypothetical protein